VQVHGQLGAALGEHLVGGQLLEFGGIRAGTEPGIRSGKDYTVHRVVGVGRAERLSSASVSVFVEGVALVGRFIVSTRTAPRFLSIVQAWIS